MPTVYEYVTYMVCSAAALLCLLPFVMILTGSLSAEAEIMKNGFSLLPQGFTLQSYKTVFEKPEVILRAHATTIGLVIIGGLIGLAMVSMTAYVLQRKDFAWRNRFSFFFYFTTLFSGGLVPSYILMSRVLGLRNNYLANPWNSNGFTVKQRGDAIFRDDGQFCRARGHAHPLFGKESGFCAVGAQRADGHAFLFRFETDRTAVAEQERLTGKVCGIEGVDKQH